VDVEFEQADALNTAIRLISIKHRARAAATLTELGLYPGQEAVLLLLDAHGPQSQIQLAVGAGCEPPSVTGMVRKLEAAGLINRRPSTHDARAVMVELTEQGRALMPRLKALWTQLAEQTVAVLTDTDPDQLITVLSDLAQGLHPDSPCAREA
jgi:DNA-binding MarR family transcriptional regulator